MSGAALAWTGLGLAVLAAFALSLVHTALAGISKIQASRLLEDRDKAERQAVLRDYDDSQTAVEFLRTVLVIAFVVYMTVVLPGLRLAPLWLFLAAVAVAAVVFEGLPRLVNVRGRETVFRGFLRTARIFRVLASPLLLLTRGLGEREEKDEEGGEHEASDEEIETFLDEAREEGIIEQGEDELLRSVVEFGDTLVREIMTPRVAMVCVRRDATIDNLKDLFIREKYSRIPVYKDRVDNVEGVVMAKDILEYADDKHKAQPIEALVRPVVFVPEAMEVADLLKELQKAKQKMAIVVDEHGGVSGLVTMEDVVEEIVGEIQDEYDTEESQILQNGPDDYTVSGGVEVEEMEELFDLDLAEDDFITVGGLISHTLGRLPARGETLDVKGLRLEVLEVDQKKVKKVRIRKS